MSLKWFKDILTGIDGESFDIARVSGAVAVVAQCALAGVHLYISHTFDAMSFGTGAAAIIAATGASIKMKQDTEPH